MTVLHLVKSADGERRDDAHHDDRRNQQQKSDVGHQSQRPRDPPQPRRHRSSVPVRGFVATRRWAAGRVGRERAKREGEGGGGDDDQEEESADDEDQTRVGRREGADMSGDVRTVTDTTHALHVRQRLRPATPFIEQRIHRVT